MPVYKYKAMRMTGERIEKICSSANREELFSRLKQQGYYPIHIEETVESREIKNISLLKGFRVTIKDIAIFCRQFYTMLNAGVPIITCLDIMRSQTENKKLRKTLSKVYEGIQRGMTFSEALKNYSDVFPNLFIYIVEAGEITGNLDSIMNRVALYYEKENSIRNKVKAAMVYPFILLVVSVCIIIFLLIFVIPMFVAMFESNSAKLPFITRLFFV
jgi:type IV pilus assembly protein PilC